MHIFALPLHILIGLHQLWIEFVQGTTVDFRRTADGQLITESKSLLVENLTLYMHCCWGYLAASPYICQKWLESIAILVYSSLFSQKGISFTLFLTWSFSLMNLFLSIKKKKKRTEIVGVRGPAHFVIFTRAFHFSKARRPSCIIPYQGAWMIQQYLLVCILPHFKGNWQILFLQLEVTKLEWFVARIYVVSELSFSLSPNQ
jgi:hypothetical protein